MESLTRYIVGIAIFVDNEHIISFFFPYSFRSHGMKVHEKRAGREIFPARAHARRVPAAAQCAKNSKNVQKLETSKNLHTGPKSQNSSKMTNFSLF